MFKVLAFFAFAASAVFAHFELNHNLLTVGHEHVAKVHHVEHVDGDAKLRFVHVVPKVLHADKFVDGFASRGTGLAKGHYFLNVLPGELLVELLGLSDCFTWHATLLTVHGADGLVHKPFAWVKKTGRALLGGVEPLAAFVFGLLHKGHFEELVKKGLPAHLFTLTLFKFFK
uniref:Potential immunogenic protein n=1 Tax=Theileria luwenshuni TaxID=540482 RepID=B3VK24_9APIC|nr:potential immunogenic protein [Theileria luwenshuni]